MKIGKQSFKFDNVYLSETSVAIGLLESQGKMKDYADIIYKDSYFNEDSFEKAERRMQIDTISKLKNKKHLIDSNIDFLNENFDLIPFCKYVNNSLILLVINCNNSDPMFSLFSISLLRPKTPPTIVNSGTINP